MKGSPDLARVRPFFHDFRKNLGGMGRVPGACLQKVSFVRPILSQTPPTSLFSYRGHRRRGGVAPVRDLANRCCVAPRGLSHSPQGSFRSPLPCGWGAEGSAARLQRRRWCTKAVIASRALRRHSLQQLEMPPPGITRIFVIFCNFSTCHPSPASEPGASRVLFVDFF